MVGTCFLATGHIEPCKHCHAGKRYL